MYLKRMSKPQFHIALVDDHDLFREGLKYIIERNPDYEVIFEANNGETFVKLLDSFSPDIVLLDIEMPKINGIEAARIAKQKQPELKILVLSMFGDQQYYHALIANGVDGFILKDSGKNELERAIADILSGKTYFSQELLKNLIPQANIGKQLTEMATTLSKREMEILTLVCQGLSNHEISEKLYISTKTVEGHKSKLMQKTNTKNSVSLVMFAIKNQFIKLN